MSARQGSFFFSFISQTISNVILVILPLFRVCYDRAPKHRLALTFILSALWHGVYPGYYFTFLTAIPITMAARAVSNPSLLEIQTSAHVHYRKKQKERLIETERIHYDDKYYRIKLVYKQ